MIISISAAGAVTLTEPREFRSFKVLTVEGVEIDGALQGAGAGRTTSADHVQISTGWLINQVGDLANDPSWRASYDAMMSYADSKGWLQGDQIAAHVEYTS